MTNMCVQFTTEGTFLRGKKPAVVAAASATRPLKSGVVVKTADDLS